MPPVAAHVRQIVAAGGFAALDRTSDDAARSPVNLGALHHLYHRLSGNKAFSYDGLGVDKYRKNLTQRCIVVH